MIKRKKPLLRKAPIKRSTVPLKRTAIKNDVLKHCDVGNHEVKSLFRSKTKTQESCCISCRTKKPISKISSTNKPAGKAKSDSIPELLKKAEKVFNAAIRKRDTDDEGRCDCISCGESLPVAEMDAGHFYSVRYSAVRFDEDNVHAQCHECNRMEYGNIDGYERGISGKIGSLRYDILRSKIHLEQKWTKAFLNGIIEKYK